MKPIVYILVLVLLSKANSQCLPTLYTSNLTTDIVQLSASQQANLYNYTFKVDFKDVPQVAIAVTEMSVGGGNSLSSGTVYVASQNTTRTGFQILMVSQGGSWIISRVTLMASTNTRLFLGSSVLQNSKVTPGNGTGSIVFQVAVLTSLPLNGSQVARGFLNGLSTLSKIGSLAITATALSQENISITVNVGSGQISALWVSFIVFNLNNGQFAAYGGYSTLRTTQGGSIDLIKGFSAVQNAIYGINAAQWDPIFNLASTSLNIDSNFLLTYTVPSGSFVLSYIFIGYPSNQTCSACPSSYYSEGQCVSSCVGNTIPIILSSRIVMCRPCPFGTDMIVTNGTCACPPSSILQGDKCISKPISSLSVQLTNQASVANAVSSNNVAIQPTSLGGINLLPNGAINQNLNFISPNSQTTTSSATIQSKNIISTPSSPVFIPTPIQIKSTLQITSTSQSIYGAISISQNCQVVNSFFNGNECVCKVGFVYLNRQCVVPQPITTPHTHTNSSTNCPANSSWNGTQCLCNSGFNLINESCSKCPANSEWREWQWICVCRQGYQMINGVCTLQKQTCPSNSQDNGLGTCVCIKNYTMVNNTCQLIEISCPANSIMANQGCICVSGFSNLSGTCSRCPAMAFWSSQSQTCVYVCGINAIYNRTLSNCVCIAGFGIDASGSCQQCTNNYYLINGYCAACPNNAFYNSQTKICQCNAGYATSPQGFCMLKCTNNERYNPDTTVCDCLAGFARIGSNCIACPSNTYIVNGQCATCPANSIMISGKCTCISGYVSNNFGGCEQCSSLPNTYMLNNYCLACANNQIYDPNTGVCSCPLGKILSGATCISACNNDQILDSKGNCFTCGLNEVISNGQCTCKQGYVRSACGACQLSCGIGYFAFMGQCALCPMSMNYLQAIGGCVCPNGFYMDPIANICQRSTFVVPTCTNGTYFDNSTQKCLSCLAVCTNCVSSSSCTSCSTGYSLNTGLCQVRCGDGLIFGSETCDSGSNSQIGCQNCQVVNGYRCVGQPSVCSTVVQPNPPTPTPTNKAQLMLKGNPSLNSNNIYITLQTNPVFTFPNPTAMQNFIQISFQNTLRPSTYCVQENAPNLSNFNCLFIYPSGLPNTKFNVFFSFNYTGYSANTTVTIDPLLFASRAPQTITRAN